MHYIRYDVLYAYVLARLQYWSMLAQKDEDKLLKRLLNASDRERNSAKKKQAAELKKAEKRKAEVDGLFAKMYEDWSAGRITEYNFNMLSEKYQNEQKELETKIRQLHETMEAAVQTAADAEKWIALMKQYVNPVELTAELLNTLIEKITVHEAVKGEDGSRGAGSRNLLPLHRQNRLTFLFYPTISLIKGDGANRTGLSDPDAAFGTGGAGILAPRRDSNRAGGRGGRSGAKAR